MDSGERPKDHRTRICMGNFSASNKCRVIIGWRDCGTEVWDLGALHEGYCHEWPCRLGY